MPRKQPLKNYGKKKPSQSHIKPSETFDYDRALEGLRRILKEVYGDSK